MDDGAARSRNRAMVDQLVRRGMITRPDVEQAFRSVLRHHFLPGVDLAEVYSGQVIPTQWTERRLTSSSSQPAIMARMLEQLAVRTSQHVLEIGTGTGYNAALLASLVGPTGEVTTIDIDPAITGEAQRNLRSARWTAVDVRTGDGWEPVAGPETFDAVEVTAAVWDLAPAWSRQLRGGGVLVVPLALDHGLQASAAFRKGASTLVSASLEPCGFIPLRGAGAAPAEAPTRVRWPGTRLDDLEVEAVPAGVPVDTVSAVAVLERPQFTYVIRDRGTKR